MAENTETRTLKASCLCGFARHEITLPASSIPLKAGMCHCNSCRHATGTLAMSVAYLPKAYEPSPELISKLQSYQFSKKLIYYHCRTCGTHMFARSEDEPKGEVTWEVTTGSLEQADGRFNIQSHFHIADTLDGGLADFLLSVDNTVIDRFAHESGAGEKLPMFWQSATRNVPTPSAEDKLHAHCKCGGVEFWIARPSERSSLGKAPWPDVLVPFHEPQPPVTENDAWWIRKNGGKYLAGLCSCNSCRLATGMEWIEWAFVPTIDITLDQSGDQPFVTEFGKLKSYRSSPSVNRFFCGGCGATIFWHGDERPQLIDVAVGILDAEEGARAESWFHWRTERLSYREDAITRAERLTLALEAGLGKYGERMQNQDC